MGLFSWGFIYCLHYLFTYVSDSCVVLIGLFMLCGFASAGLVLLCFGF